MLWSCCGSSVPTVLIDFPPPSLVSRTANLAILLDSDEDIGGRGAEYFMKLGSFASYAFIPDSGNRGWSRLRERGYKKILRKTGFDSAQVSPCRNGSIGALRDYPHPFVRG